jgi:hypothetical protein
MKLRRPSDMERFEQSAAFFLRSSLHGIGGVALASLLARDAFGAGASTQMRGLPGLPDGPEARIAPQTGWARQPGLLLCPLGAAPAAGAQPPGAAGLVLARASEHGAALARAARPACAGRARWRCWAARRMSLVSWTAAQRPGRSAPAP